ncbi:cytochrome c oxidase subunit II [Halobacteriales archaeon QS_8_69_26]|nr:MAG: cytochrome c oxidase subunit II [Halobacteriales archaeon QS_8_69_26]
MIGYASLLSVPLQQLVPRGTRVTVFQNIFWVFLVLGTLVGIVVIGYMFWNAYRYRDGNGKDYDDGDLPQLGEIPKDGGKGRKLFLSFGLSAIIVISLIVWTYGTLLFVEGQDTGQPSSDVGVENKDPVVVDTTGYRFNWSFEYENGKETNGRLVVPEGRVVQLRVTSDDVFHNLGIPKYRVKTDAIPGETTRSWFVAEDPGRYRIICYELCGQGHSGMIAYIHVVPQEEYEQFINNESSLSEISASDDESGRLAAAR